MGWQGAVRGQEGRGHRPAALQASVGRRCQPHLVRPCPGEGTGGLRSTGPGVSRGRGGGPGPEEGCPQAEPGRAPGGITCHRWESRLGLHRGLVTGLSQLSKCPRRLACRALAQPATLSPPRWGCGGRAALALARVWLCPRYLAAWLPERPQADQGLSWAGSPGKWPGGLGRMLTKGVGGCRRHQQPLPPEAGGPGLPAPRPGLGLPPPPPDIGLGVSSSCPFCWPPFVPLGLASGSNHHGD